MRDGPAVFRDINPHRWSLWRAEPGPLSQRPLAAHAGRRRARRLLRHDRRARRRSSPTTSRGRPRTAPASTALRLLLRRVRVPRLDADLLGRPRRPRGRHPQGGERSGPADDRHRPLLPARLLPAAARPLGAPAGVPAGTTRRASDGARLAPTDAADADGPGRRPAAHLPGLARRRRPGAAAPARHGAAGERRRRALDDGPALRGQPRRAARPVRPARDRGRPGAATRSRSSRR